MGGGRQNLPARKRKQRLAWTPGSHARFEGYGLQPVRKPRNINGALAPDGTGWFGFTFAGAEDGFNH